MVAGATGTRVHPLRTVHVALQEELASGEPPESLSRPFDAGRTGMVLGEGAGAVLLERLDKAEARGATIYGEICGQASSTVMSRDGRPQCRTALANVLRQCLRAAEWTPEQLRPYMDHVLESKRP